MQMKITDVRDKRYSRNHHCLHSQSAMEYLMTYGWAILIIAVVLGALYYLGVFNSSTLGPRAQPGSCRVLRPLGSGTTSYINLGGVCTGQLPQFVASFNGQGSYVNVGSGTGLLSLTAFTVSAWVKHTGPVHTSYHTYLSLFSGSAPAISVDLSGTAQDLAIIYMSASNFRYFNTNPVNYLDGNWHHIVFVVTGNTQYDISNSIMYADGASESVYSTTTSGPPDSKTGPVYIGKDSSGLISNVQIYNTSLDASAIQSLYAEGIGGAPQVLQNLDGWWPLNGNANDYSGNNNNGVPTSVTYTSTWTGGYQGH